MIHDYVLSEHEYLYYDNIRVLWVDRIRDMEICRCKCECCCCCEPKIRHFIYYLMGLENKRVIKIQDFPFFGMSEYYYGMPEITWDKWRYKDERRLYTRYADYKNTATNFISRKRSSLSDNRNNRFADSISTLLFGF